MEEIRIYLDHVAEFHADGWDKYANRMAPEEFIREFKQELEHLQQALKNKKRHTTKRNIWINRFVQTFSTPYPQTSM